MRLHRLYIHDHQSNLRRISFNDFLLRSDKHNCNEPSTPVFIFTRTKIFTFKPPHTQFSLKWNIYLIILAPIPLSDNVTQLINNILQTHRHRHTAEEWKHFPITHNAWKLISIVHESIWCSFVNSDTFYVRMLATNCVWLISLRFRLGTVLCMTYSSNNRLLSQSWNFLHRAFTDNACKARRQSTPVTRLWLHGSCDHFQREENPQNFFMSSYRSSLTRRH